jgi:hypothetical protein
MTKCVPILAVLAATIAVLPAVAAPPKPEIQVPWEVKPDPLPFKMDGPFQTNKQFSLAHPSPVVFPTSPSPYFGVFIPADKKEPPQLKMYDLRGMEQVGQTIKHDKLQYPQRTIRVSPWGDHIAIIDNKADKPTVWLATVTDAKIVASIVPHEGKEKIECWDFAGKDQLITCMEADGKRTWRIWDVKTGKEIRSFDYPLEFSEKWMAFSPGRRYLVMQETHIQSYNLLFWDLQKGECVGKMPMQDPKAPWGQCGNLAFSNDGKELALLWYLNKDGVLAKIMRFDLEKGAKIGELSLGEEIKPAGAGFLCGGMCTLQYLPDDRGWLVSGCQIVECESGIPVCTIDPCPRSIEQTRNRRFLDATHVTDQTKDKKLQILTLPKAELDAALDKARSKAK